ncbi:MAG: RNA pseudouridine synthase [Oscillospiraceae bacterium]|nr:RNA pseudouridine synthase [Oscillospiraceae bacterium]
MKIICNSNSFIVCRKPAGVLSQEGSGKNMPSLLREEPGCSEIYPVHRLDTAASGLMVFAKSKSAAAALSSQMSGGEFIKEYMCVVHGVPEKTEGELTDLLFKDSAKNKSYVVKKERRGVKKARLIYKVFGTAETEKGVFSLIKVRLITGRTHQIRVQFSSRKMPLCGDGKYGAKDSFNNLALYSCRISFAVPETGEILNFESAPPETEPWNYFNAL